VIPKIGATSKVIANVDPSSEKLFLPFLKEGVAHAQGSVFPGMKGNIYLFAHSTDNFWDVGRYNAVFYLLKDLNKGDEVIVFFNNVRHNYVVYDTKVVSASEVSYLVDSQKAEKETLILQTCWPPGTTWKRLLVFARPK
jgi:LPXTG-site transpeptidase (sortase) family protein